MDNYNLLSQASQLAESGRFDQARQLVLQAIQNNKSDTEAWWALAHVARTDTERHRAVREVLRLDPNHLHAQHMRDQIQAGSLESLEHPGKLADRKAQADDDYMPKVAITLVAYFVFSIVGFVLNIVFLYEARKFRQQYGFDPKNVGCLWAMLATFIIVPTFLCIFITSITLIGSQMAGY